MSNKNRTWGVPDRQAFEDWYEVIYEPHEWPDDALLVLSWYRQGKSAPSSAHLPLTDRDVIWKEIIRRGADRKIWCGVAPRSPRALNELIATKQQDRVAKGQRAPSKRQLLEWTRGGKRECYPIPGVWLDLDIAGGEHKKKNVPPSQDVERLLDEFPLGRPTVLIHTGGGYHAWYAFAELLESAAEEENLLARVHAWLLGQEQRTGYDYDTEVFSRDRVLRPAGSLVGKRGDLSTIRTVELNPSLRYTTWDFDVLPLPPAPEPKAPSTAAPRNAGGPVHTVGQVGAGGRLRPGDRLAAELPVSRLLGEVFGCIRRGNRWVFPRADGTYSTTDTHLITSTGIRFSDDRTDIDDGIERVGVFGDRAATALGLKCQGPPATSFTVLTNAFCAGDWSLAARIAKAFAGDPDALVSVLQTRPSVGDLAALVHRQRASEREGRPGRDTTGENTCTQPAPAAGALLRSIRPSRSRQGGAPGSVLAQLHSSPAPTERQPRLRSA